MGTQAALAAAAALGDGKVIIEVSGSDTYVGQAPIGTATSSALWKIQKISVSGTTTTITYADGNTSADNIWDNRASLTYS